jgi:hypothetical protein
MTPPPSSAGVAYEDEGRDALAVPTPRGAFRGVPSTQPPSVPPLGAVPAPVPRRTAPPPSAAKAVLKVLALVALAGMVAVLIAVVALLAR